MKQRDEPTRIELSSQPQLAVWNGVSAKLLWAYRGAVPDPQGNTYYSGLGCIVWILLKGRVRLRFGEETERFGAGDCVLGRMVQGRQQFTSDAELVSVRFELTRQNGQPLFRLRQSIKLDARDSPGLRAAAERAVAFVGGKLRAGVGEAEGLAGLPCYLGLQAHAYALAEAYAVALTARGVAPVGGPLVDDRVQRALDRVYAGDLRAQLTERELAEQVGLSVSQLNKLFVSSTGKTPAQHLRERRLELVMRLLRESRGTIKQTAYEAGFSSPQRLANWFRGLTGATPSDWRAKGNGV